MDYNLTQSDCVAPSYLQAAVAENMIANLVFRVILDLTEILFAPQHVAFLKSITNLCQLCLSLLLIINKRLVLMFHMQFNKYAL